jgi:uncharacterized membrane protein YuzA (DUF378 family)
MDMMRRFEPLALVLMIIGALNWGIVGITDGDTNVLSKIFGTGTLTNVIYVVIGVAALAYLPKLMETFHLGEGPHPRGV